ncbi:MAG: beta-carotene hydroxylase, partial [Bacteroidetes bacterium]|nr:beta-carotene hydroxylase [Bacteroidota bacterium]
MIFLLVMLATFLIMEGITWLTHKYIMHGFLWVLHEDHHQPTGHFFEKNDAFFLIFAIPSMLCIFLGTFNHMYWLAGLGTGVALYGFAYFLVHEVIIHQRIKWFTRS